MLEQVLDHLHNYFEVAVQRGTFTISDGAIQSDLLQDGQYYRITGSVFNDGVHQYPSSDLTSETFTGEIRAMAVPPAVIALSQEIKEWADKYAGVIESPYNSESFGGYSYTKGSGEGSATWQDIFRSRLNRWRKMP